MICLRNSTKKSDILIINEPLQNNHFLSFRQDVSHMLPYFDICLEKFRNRMRPGSNMLENCVLTAWGDEVTSFDWALLMISSVSASLSTVAVLDCFSIQMQLSEMRLKSCLWIKSSVTQSAINPEWLAPLLRSSFAWHRPCVCTHNDLRPDLLTAYKQTLKPCFHVWIAFIIIFDFQKYREKGTLSGNSHCVALENDSLATSLLRCSSKTPYTNIHKSLPLITLS